MNEFCSPVCGWRGRQPQTAAMAGVHAGHYYLYPNIFNMLCAFCSLAYTQSTSLPFLS